jgi:hypothetical protein
VAARSEDLYLQPRARVYKFPPVRARRAAIRRRRLALGATGLVVVAASILATGPSGTTSAAPSSRSRVVVRSGHTAWDVATRHAPAHMDPRAYLDAILATNQISVAEIQPGTVLRLP